MGVFPSTRPGPLHPRRLPHARGGVSPLAAMRDFSAASSPRPWGCFYPQRADTRPPRVFPTPVGVFLFMSFIGGPPLGLPHARGGVSAISSCIIRAFMVFPTPVGVFLPLPPPCVAPQGLPHARGGVSGCCPLHGSLFWSSPRPWGCFYLALLRPVPNVVFPTPVGVFLSRLTPSTLQLSLPHARGGVSLDKDPCCTPVSSSPRPWGCFRARFGDDLYTRVFPTPVGVFLPTQTSCTTGPSLPHARGGVSQLIQGSYGGTRSSPRPWGCFHGRYGQPQFLAVFPTPVGVFPLEVFSWATTLRLPHARGGVSTWVNTRHSETRSSPRPWGCFSAHEHCPFG